MDFQPGDDDDEDSMDAEDAEQASLPAHVPVRKVDTSGLSGPEGSAEKQEASAALASDKEASKSESTVSGGVQGETSRCEQRPDGDWMEVKHHNKNSESVAQQAAKDHSEAARALFTTLLPPTPNKAGTSSHAVLTSAGGRDRSPMGCISRPINPLEAVHRPLEGAHLGAVAEVAVGVKVAGLCPSWGYLQLFLHLVSINMDNNCFLKMMYLT